MTGLLGEYLVEARLADLARELEACRLEALARAANANRPAPHGMPQRRSFRPLARFTRTSESR